jgi:Cu(I)/Ag(I) efflux system protein CusF
MMMRIVTATAAGLVLILGLSTAAFAQMVKGDVQKVDEAAGKVTLKHGPIPKFDMEDMTMVYRVQDPSMLKGVKAGDKIMFDADKVDGKFTVTKMEKAK